MNKQDKEKIKKYCQNKFRPYGMATRETVEKAMSFIVKWKEKQLINKAYDVMRDIYEHYGNIPENCKEEFKQALEREDQI